MKYIAATIIVIVVNLALEKLSIMVEFTEKLSDGNYKYFKITMSIILIIFAFLMELFIRAVNVKFDNENFLSLILRVIDIFIIGKLAFAILISKRNELI